MNEDILDPRGFVHWMQEAAESEELKAIRSQASPTNNPAWDVIRHIPSEGFGVSPWSRSLELRGHPAIAEVLGYGEPEPQLPNRDFVCWHWTWAIPEPAALSFVAEYSNQRIVEIGAGTGYWAWQLTQLGVNVVAYDRDPPNRRFNHWHANHDGPRHVDRAQPLRPIYYNVLTGTANKAAKHPDRTLFLCWPPYNAPMALDALTAYQGKRLIYIGENGGCNADDAFFEALAEGWEQTADHDLPQWSGLHDHVEVYDRKLTP